MVYGEYLWQLVNTTRIWPLNLSTTPEYEHIGRTQTILSTMFSYCGKRSLRIAVDGGCCWWHWRYLKPVCLLFVGLVHDPSALVGSFGNGHKAAHRETTSHSSRVAYISDHGILISSPSQGILACQINAISQNTKKFLASATLITRGRLTPGRTLTGLSYEHLKALCAILAICLFD